MINLQHYHVLRVCSLCIFCHHLHLPEHNIPPPLSLSHPMIPPIYHSQLIRNIYIINVIILNIYDIQSVVWNLDRPLQRTAPNIPMFLHPTDLCPSIFHEVEWFYIIQTYATRSFNVGSPTNFATFNVPLCLIMLSFIM